MKTFLRHIPNHSAIGLFSVLLAGSAFSIPLASHAATVQSGRVVTVSSSTLDNAYYAGGQVSVNSPLPHDLSVAGGTVTVSAPVGADALLAGGTVEVQKPIGGDARIIGGRINIEDSVSGDLVAAGGFVTFSGKAHDTRIAGGTVQLSDGSDGDVTIYGADVTLSGEYKGNVEVIASDHITIGEGTVIHGTFRYNAPQQAEIPSSVQVDQGVQYIGSATFLPTVQEAKTFAVAGLWVFLIVRITAGLVAVGLIVGLFPELTNRVVQSVVSRSAERNILLALLGIGTFILVPLLLILLLVSFVGIGIALIVGAAYLLFALLSYVYAMVLAGALILRLVRRRSDWSISWRGALLGVVVLYLVGLIPVVGVLIKVVLSAAAGGALLTLGYRFSFRKEPLDFMDL